MEPRFIGNLNWAKQRYDTPDLWRLEEPYAQLTRDGHLVMCPLMSGIDGASIPRPLWIIPYIGHPFEKDNKFWSPPHDFGYRGTAIVIDMKTELAGIMDVEQWAGMWHSIPEEMKIDPRSLGKHWWDKTLLEGMQVCEASRVKQFTVYRGVWIGGGRAWRKAA
jgi:hypothetical protein